MAVGKQRMRGEKRGAKRASAGKDVDLPSHVRKSQEQGRQAGNLDRAGQALAAECFASMRTCR